MGVKKRMAKEWEKYNESIIELCKGKNSEGRRFLSIALTNLERFIRKQKPSNLLTDIINSQLMLCSQAYKSIDEENRVFSVEKEDRKYFMMCIREDIIKTEINSAKYGEWYFMNGKGEIFIAEDMPKVMMLDEKRYAYGTDILLDELGKGSCCFKILSVRNKTENIKKIEEKPIFAEIYRGNKATKKLIKDYFEISGAIIDFPPETENYDEVKKEIFPQIKEGRDEICVKKGEKLVLFPSDGMGELISLLEDEPKEIYISVYRLAHESRVANALMRAAVNGCKVNVIIELRAGYEGGNNLHWSNVLRAAGCSVIFGGDKKVHAKLALIKGENHECAVISTGNFNEETSKSYTDAMVITEDKSTVENVEAFFRSCFSGKEFKSGGRLFLSPLWIKELLLKKIEEQVKKKGEGEIVLKANALTDREIISTLKTASDEGVKIHLIIRGACLIKESENINIKRIVGNYLEHSRIFVFGKNGENGVYISSADLERKNDKKRIEAAYEIKKEAHKKRLIALINVLENKGQEEALKIAEEN